MDLDEPREVYFGFRIPRSLDRALIAYGKAHGLRTKSAAAVHALRWALELNPGEK